jgi:hypothetical protein
MTDLYGILLVTDVVEGVHLIVTNPDDEERDLRWLNQFLWSHAESKQHTHWPFRQEIEADAVPRQVHLWPDLSAFAGQFGVTVHRHPEDDA